MVFFRSYLYKFLNFNIIFTYLATLYLFVHVVQTHLDVGNAFPSMKHLEIATQLITETFIPWAKPAAALPSTNSFKDLRLAGKLWRFNHRPRNGVLDKFCVHIFLHPNFPFWYSLNISSSFLKQTYTSHQFRDLSANNILTLRFLRFWDPASQWNYRDGYLEGSL